MQDALMKNYLNGVLLTSCLLNPDFIYVSLFLICSCFICHHPHFFHRSMTLHMIAESDSSG